MLVDWYQNTKLHDNLTSLGDFILAPRKPIDTHRPAMSLFSGAGISDLGYEQAGFRFVVQVELDEDRARLCQRNFPHSVILQKDIASSQREIVRTYKKLCNERLELLSVTPPCQGMSSSNPGRGKISKIEDRDQRNGLMLTSIPIIRALLPRIVVIENVSPILKENITIDDGSSKPLINIFKDALRSKYRVFTGMVQTADYGIPQTRKRAIIVAIHKQEPCLNTLDGEHVLPWPKAKHSDKSNKGLDWISVSDWFDFRCYPPLDASDSKKSIFPSDMLHRVPSYEDNPDRYSWVADIPPNSGRNAYQNANCRTCGFTSVPEGLSYCPQCNEPMRNRPYVLEKSGDFRLVKGFHSSYRRMSPDKPAPTVMTNSSHLGSDYKIHPWENRVLSIRECSDLQTIPQFYDWSWAFDTKHIYVTRQVIGEALPSWFTYLHGLALQQLLDNKINTGVLCNSSRDNQ